MRLKRLLDRLMYRLGYVTRERYMRAAAPKIVLALDELDDPDQTEVAVYAARLPASYRRRPVC